MFTWNPLKLQREADMPKWVADRRLYLSEDGRVVSEAEPGRKWLLAPAGRVVPDDVCRRYNLGPYAQPETVTASTVAELTMVVQPEAEIPKPHRHRWRKNGRCQCGEIKVKE
jgi:hypothetical protein